MKAIQRFAGATALALLLAVPAAHAQRVVEGDLQTQMSPEQFRAAGLHKLGADELAALNAWLQGGSSRPPPAPWSRRARKGARRSSSRTAAS